MLIFIIRNIRRYLDSFSRYLEIVFVIFRTFFEEFRIDIYAILCDICV